jgi:DNA-binding beta-propeller fold protein YncE
MRASTLLVVALAGCATARQEQKEPSAAQALALPGAPPDGVSMDYIAYDAAHRRVWVPAGNTGSVDVIDTATGTLSRIEGFPTSELERRGKKRTVGPSSVTVGEGVVYVGNRGDSSVCAIDEATLARGTCVKLDAMPDAVVFVKAMREVWVTTPRDHSIRVLDASKTLAQVAKLDFDGEPEGFAVDDERGLFFTNLEDKDRTLAIDLKSRKVVETWQPSCGDDGPKGLALDRALDFLAVACTDHLVLLDAGHQGRVLSKLDTGPGVDNIDYVEARHELYAAAGGAAQLTVARLAADGTLQASAVLPTSKGARNAVATEAGVAYVTDGPRGSVLVVGAPGR